MPPEDHKVRLAERAKRAGLSNESIFQLTNGRSTADEVAQVMDAFFLTLQPEAFSAWLDTPVPALDGSTPRHLIQVGRAQEVRDGLLSLADGNPT